MVYMLFEVLKPGDRFNHAPNDSPRSGGKGWAFPAIGAGDPRYRTMRERDKRRDELNALVSEWAARFTAQELLDRCEAHEMACGLLYNIADIFNDPQYRARGNIKRMSDARVGEFYAPNVIPRLSATPGSLDHLGPALGAHNEEVFGGLLGMTPTDLEELRDAKVV